MRVRLSIGAVAGLVIVGVNLLAATFAPWIAPHGEAEFVGDAWAAPYSAAPLGLDNLGRDLWSRLLYGAQTTIGIACASTLLAFAIGMAAGFTAAILGGWKDVVLSRIVDVVISIPTLIMALMVLTVLNTSVPVLIGTIAVITSTRVFRISRAVAMDIVSLDYIEAARLRGEGLWWVLRRELLPNALPPLVVEFGLRFCFTVLFLTSLSFLGLGLQPPTADWGGMVRENAQALTLGAIAPLIPALAIAQLTIGVNLVVDWYLTLQHKRERRG